MLTFTLAISCLTTSNLPWFMDLTFQVPKQYCSLQHRTLLLSPVTSTAGYCFCFGSTPSFFLELFLHWSPVAYWAPTDLGTPLSVSYHFAFSYCSWGSQGKNTEVVCHSLLQWTTFCQISPPWPSYLGKKNPSKTVGVARGHQRADTLKPYSQETSQSNHTRTTALSNYST